MFVLFFFFKQKTAYEMRISDWSSDVCSSDLDAVDAVDFRDRADQQREIRDFAVAIRSTIGIDVLPQQVDLAHALGRQLRHFHQHVLERTADLDRKSVV